MEQLTASSDHEPQGLRDALQTAAKTPFAREAVARAREGALEGIGTGTSKLFERLIAHPLKAVTAASSLPFGVYKIVETYPWLKAEIRALVRLVTKA